MLKLKRAYDPVSHTDGTRLLVERLWPRGLSKAKLHVDVWLEGGGTQHRIAEVVQPRSDEVGHGSARGTSANSTRVRRHGGRSSPRPGVER